MSDIQGTTEQTNSNVLQIDCGLSANSAELQSKNEIRQRDELGRVLPGVCINPGGRPKTAHIREAMQQRLATDGAAIVADVPFDIAANPLAKHSDRLNAVEIIRDTVDGKPIQAHMVAMAVDPNAVNTIAALAARLLGDT